jgi:hypothetical protein
VAGLTGLHRFFRGGADAEPATVIMAPNYPRSTFNELPCGSH